MRHSEFAEAHEPRRDSGVEGQSDGRVLSNYFSLPHADDFALRPTTRSSYGISNPVISPCFTTTAPISRLTLPAISTSISDNYCMYKSAPLPAPSPSPAFWQSPATRASISRGPQGGYQQPRTFDLPHQPLKNLYQRQSTASAQSQSQLTFLQTRSSNSALPTTNTDHTPYLHPSSLYSTSQPRDRWSSPTELVSSPSMRLSMRPPMFSQDLPSTQVQQEERGHRGIRPEDDFVKASGKALFLDFPGVPPMVNGIRLVTTSTMPDRLRQIFSFALFNAIQSKCFDPVFNTDNNVVVSAPTGGGKTAILEMAICRLIQNQQSGNFKIVYQAPTKSLCSERTKDWQSKFSALGLECAELTGDTNASEMKKVASATIIVTTPEKWDSITRKWSDHEKLLRMVKLLLVDEVHVVADIRGATLEAVVSRMRTIGASVRMIALSATVPNSYDIAVWLGKNPNTPQEPAHREVFGEEFRPVPLTKYVHGYNSNGNDFGFESRLDSEITGLIARYTHKKPIMVFCFTRKSCEVTAGKLSDWWHASKLRDRAWAAPTREIPVLDKNLHKLVRHGVAYHHAGLDLADRRAIEVAYTDGNLNVIVCTSTLAVGVNLPCHMVVIKGTLGFSQNTLREYPDLEVMQMLGRAGRPQFDSDAVAVIMTQKDKVERYQSMNTGQQTLESTLHFNLIEHLNSEVTLGTVHNLQSAKAWVLSTFLAVRLKQNPAHYSLDGGEITVDPESQLGNVCERDVKRLQEVSLITEGPQITATQYGHIMSKLMISFVTMKRLLEMPRASKMEAILSTISEASEFNEIRMKPAERTFFRELNKSNCLRFAIKETVSTQAHKIRLLIQARLSCIEIQFGKGYSKMTCMRETGVALEHAARLVRAVFECKVYASDAVTTLAASELARSIKAGLWENSPHQLRQVSSIGPALSRKFISKNVRTIEQLVSLSSDDIERICSRNPPLGKKVLDAASSIPKLSLKANIIKAVINPGETPRLQIRATLALDNEKTLRLKKGLPSVSFIATVSNDFIAYTWSGSLAKVARDNSFEIMFSAELTSQNDVVVCYFHCDGVVGTEKSTEIRPDVPLSAFPVKAPIPKLPTFMVPKIHIDDDSEFDSEIEEADLLDALNNVDRCPAHIVTSNEQPCMSQRDFVDIDTFNSEPEESNPDRDVQHSSSKSEYTQPAQMGNGRWQCSHPCRNGRPTKSKKPCKHKCCHEGLEKLTNSRKRKVECDVQESVLKRTKPKHNKKLPRQSEGSSSQTRLSFTGRRNELESDEIVTLDMAETEEIPKTRYEDLGPRDYRKLHSLHSNVQRDNHLSLLPRTKPLFSYSKGNKPDLPSLLARKAALSSKDEDPFADDMEDSDDREELPSLGSLLSSNSFTSARMFHDLVQTTSDEFAASIEDPEAAMVGIDASDLYQESAIQPVSNDFTVAVRSNATKSESTVDADFVYDEKASDCDTAQESHDASFAPQSPLDARTDYLQADSNVTPISANDAECVPSIHASPATKPCVPLWIQDLDASLIEFLGSCCEFEPDH